MLRPMSRLTSDASCGTSVVNPGTLSSANPSKTRLGAARPTESAATGGRAALSDRWSSSERSERTDETRRRKSELRRNQTWPDSAYCKKTPVRGFGFT